MATALPAPGIRAPSAAPVAADTSAGVDAAGAVWHPSPNHGPRRDGLLPELVVLHYTAMRSAQAALDRLCDPSPPAGLGPVSAHYLIGPDGTLWQMVREASRAWHAGTGAWGGAGDVNSRSIGIELANTGAAPFAAPQMDALEHLLRGIMTRWAIPAHGVIAHSDMAPGRKVDPGPRFDWRRLARQGLALWPATAGGEENHPFHAALDALGYPGTADGVAEDDRLAAFRLRFRPQATGPLDDADRRLACACLAASRAVRVTA